MNFIIEGHSDELFKCHQKINIVYTFRCNAQCAHCIVEASPHDNTKLSVNQVCEILQLAWVNGKRMLVLTGGEVFLFPDELESIIEYAHSLGFYIAVETNGFWASNLEETIIRLNRLKSLGLHEIYTSADAFHHPFIPLSFIKNIRQAARETDIVCEINYYRSNQSDLDRMVFESMNFGNDEESYFTETLSEGGKDVSSFLCESDYVSPSELEENGSTFLNFLPNGDVFVNVDTNRRNIEMKASRLYLGNIFQQSLSSLFNKEKSCVYENLYILQGNELHRMLIMDQERGKHYKQKYATKKYLTLSSYYCDILSDSVLASILDCPPVIFLDKVTKLRSEMIK